MAKNELKEQLKSYEETVNNIPLVIDPCKMCKVYKENKGYEISIRVDTCLYKDGRCKECCWYYDSKFEIGVSDNSCRTCKHYDKITSGKEPCNSCDNGNRWQ